MIENIHASHPRKPARASHPLAVAALLSCVTSLLAVDAAPTAPAIVPPGPASAPPVLINSNDVETPSASAPVPWNAILLADNQTASNTASPADTAPATATEDATPVASDATPPAPTPAPADNPAPAPATVTTSAAPAHPTAGQPAIPFTTAGNDAVVQLDSTSISPDPASPPPPAPQKMILLADNNTTGNATPIIEDTATAPTTTSGGGPLVGPGSATPAPTPVVAGYSGFKIPFLFGVGLNTVYDDNIYIRSNNRVGDFYWTVTPSVEYQTRQIDQELDSLDTQPENYFHFYYKPEFAEFLQQTQNDFIDHHAEANYVLSMPRLQLGLDSGFNTSHYPNVDFGGRLKATYFTDRFYWQYVVTNRLTLGGDTAMTLSRYEQGIDTNDFTNTAYLDYELSAKVKLGVGTTLGHVEVADSNPGQNYEQFYLRSSYQVRDKISLTGQAGAEVRQYDGGTSTTSPNFTVGAIYQPFDSTTLQLQGRRRTVPSISQYSADYNDTDVALIMRQRLLHEVYVNLRTSFEHDDYFNVRSGNSTGLTYDYFTIRPSIEWDWNKYAKFTAYYEYQDNHAPSASLGFYDNSVGFGVGFSF